MYLLEKRKVCEAPKLNPTYHGPFLVKQKVNEVDFIVQLDKEGKEQITLHDKLKPYEGVHIPRWVHNAKKRLLAEKHSQK